MKYNVASAAMQKSKILENHYPKLNTSVKHAHIFCHQTHINVSNVLTVYNECLRFIV